MEHLVAKTAKSRKKLVDCDVAEFRLLAFLIVSLHMTAQPTTQNPANGKRLSLKFIFKAIQKRGKRFIKE